MQCTSLIIMINDNNCSNSITYLSQTDPKLK